MKKTNVTDKLTVFSDINALIIYVCFFSLFFFSSLFTIVLCYITQQSYSALMTLIISLFLCCAGLAVALIVGARKWAATITLTYNGIYVKPFLKNGYSKEFGDLPFIRKAWRSRSLRLETEALRKYYIVISSYELSEYERSKINYLSNSQNAIKIEFNKKNYQKLLNILPEGHKVQLIEQFADLANK